MTTTQAPRMRGQVQAQKTRDAEEARAAKEAKEAGGAEVLKGHDETAAFEGAGTSRTSVEEKRAQGLEKLIEADTQALTELSDSITKGAFTTPEALKQAQSHAELLTQRLVSNTTALMMTKTEAPVADKALEGDLSLKLDTVRHGAPGGKAAAPVKGAPTDKAGAAAKPDARAEVMLHRALRLGSEGEDVAELTQHLANLKPPLLESASSTFTPEVQDAVKKYQQKKSLSVDGIVGEQTWGAIHGIKLPPGVSGLRPATAQEIVAHAPAKAAGAEGKAEAAGAEAKPVEGAAATAEAKEAAAGAAGKPEAQEAAKGAAAEAEPTIMGRIEAFIDYVKEALSPSAPAKTGEAAPAKEAAKPSAEAVSQFKEAIKNAQVSPEALKEALEGYKETDLVSRELSSAFSEGAAGLREAGKDDAADVFGHLAESSRTLNTAGTARAAATAHQSLSRYMMTNAEKILISDPAVANAAVTGNGIPEDKMKDIADPRLRRLVEAEYSARGKFEGEAAKAVEVNAGVAFSEDQFLSPDEISMLKSLQEYQ